MIIALVIWARRIAPVYDCAGSFACYRMAQGMPEFLENREFGNRDLEGKARHLRDAGVQAVVCGALSGEARASLHGHGIEVYGFVTGEAEEILEALKKGCLVHRRFSMPGCGWPRHWRCRKETERKGDTL